VKVLAAAVGDIEHERALEEIAAEQGGMTEDKAAGYVANLRKSGCYLREVY